MINEILYKCPKCGEEENLHYNYDYSKQHRPIDDVLCGKCGEIFGGNMKVADLPSAKTESQKWDELYAEYSAEQWPPFGGPFTDSLQFIDWLKLNFNSPVRLQK